MRCMRTEPTIPRQPIKTNIFFITYSCEVCAVSAVPVSNWDVLHITKMQLKSQVKLINDCAPIRKSNLSHTPPTVAGSHKKRKDYRANNPRNGIFFRRYFIDPDYGFSTKKISLSRLRKKRIKALCRRALTSDTIIVVALIFTAKRKWKKRGKKACYRREFRISGITLIFFPGYRGGVRGNYFCLAQQLEGNHPDDGAGGAKDGFHHRPGFSASALRWRR